MTVLDPHSTATDKKGTLLFAERKLSERAILFLSITAIIIGTVLSSLLFWHMAEGNISRLSSMLISPAMCGGMVLMMYLLRPLPIRIYTNGLEPSASLFRTLQKKDHTTFVPFHELASVHPFMQFLDSGPRQNGFVVVTRTGRQANLFTMDPTTQDALEGILKRAIGERWATYWKPWPYIAPEKLEKMKKAANQSKHRVVTIAALLIIPHHSRTRP